MDKILEALLASEVHSNEQKTLFVKNVIISEAFQKICQETKEIELLSDLSIKWILTEKTKTKSIQSELGYLILRGICNQNPEAFSTYFDAKWFSFPQKQSNHWIQLVLFIFQLKSSNQKIQQDAKKIVSIIQNSIYNIVINENDSFFKNEIISIWFEEPCLLSPNLDISKLCVSWIANEKQRSLLDKENLILDNIFPKLDQRKKAEILVQVLNFLSNTDYSEKISFLPLFFVLTKFPIEYVQLVHPFFQQSKFNNKQLELTLLRILKWPLRKGISNWAVAILTFIISSKTFSVLINVAKKRLNEVFKQIPDLFLFEISQLKNQKNSFSLDDPNANQKTLNEIQKKQLPSTHFAWKIIKTIIYGLAHSPAIFHQVINEFPVLIGELEKNGTIYADLFIKKIVRLLFCAIYQFPGYPELYESLLSLLEKYSSLNPPESVIRKIWAKNSLTSIKDANELLKYDFTCQPKSETGYSGLTNIGNTCFMNSFIQALFITKDFRDDIFGAPFTEIQTLQNSRNSENERSIYVFELQRVFAFLLLTQRHSYSPYHFFRVLPDQYKNGMQQDSSEFGMVLLDLLHTEMQKLQDPKKLTDSPKIMSESLSMEENQIKADGTRIMPDGNRITEERSIVEISNMSNSMEMIETQNSMDTINSQKSMDIINTQPETSKIQQEIPTFVSQAFQGKIQSETTCALCGNKVYKKEPFFELSLSFDSKSKNVQTLSELFQNFQKQEKLDEKNLYLCEKCHKYSQAEKRMRIAEYPNNFIITLKRFCYDPKRKSMKKLLNQVDFPVELKLIKEDLEASVNSKFSSLQERKIEEIYYDLYAVIIHSGYSPVSGHYFVYGRSLDSIQTNQESQNNKFSSNERWIAFNDSSVSYSSLKNLLELNTKFPHNTPYILFYKKRSQKPQAFKPSNLNISPLMVKLVQIDNEKLIDEEKNQEQKINKKIIPNFSHFHNNYYEDEDDDDFGGGNDSNYYNNNNNNNNNNNGPLHNSFSNFNSYVY